MTELGNICHKEERYYKMGQFPLQRRTGLSEVADNNRNIKHTEAASGEGSIKCIPSKKDKVRDLLMCNKLINTLNASVALI